VAHNFNDVFLVVDDEDVNLGKFGCGGSHAAQRELMRGFRGGA